jgi:VIT1/CCC1 family predicted Fe2+/Mn2+ transporter
MRHNFDRIDMLMAVVMGIILGIVIAAKAQVGFENNHKPVAAQTTSTITTRIEAMEQWRAEHTSATLPSVTAIEPERIEK